MEKNFEVTKIEFNPLLNNSVNDKRIPENTTLVNLVIYYHDEDNRYKANSSILVDEYSKNIDSVKRKIRRDMKKMTNVEELADYFNKLYEEIFSRLDE